jgi:hypothetical protein
MSARAYVLLWLVNLGAVLFMTGLIWLVQIVHYPLMADVGADRFPAYHALHSARITLIVGPMMVLELATAGALVLWAPPAELASAPGSAARALGLALTLATWAVTFFLSVPAHGELAQGFDRAAHAGLVSTNWLRTLAWSAHAVLALWATGRMLVR